MSFQIVGSPTSAANQLIAHLRSKPGFPADLFPEESESKESLVCREHGTKNLDVWYDCEKCLEESHAWARRFGYDQCVSPHITRAGTDGGRWVAALSGRWVTRQARPYRLK